jgi:hypothetical protein
MTTEAPSIGERYRRAINSSDLRVRERVQGDADLLMAAGFSDSLGILLYRMAAEYDQIAQDVRRTAANDRTELLLILMHLKSLSATKEALALHALQTATRRHVMLPDSDVIQLTGRVLTAWLDPNCHKCEGVGKIGGYDGKVQHICRACGGSGKSRQAVGKNDVERLFASYLLSDMDRRLHEADHHLRKHLR